MIQIYLKMVLRV